MDSLSQFALGAAVGEATLGEKLGYRAALWGGFFGTLPDLDVLAYPLLTGVQELSFHRGITHSIFFCVLAAPMIGRVLQRIYQRRGTTWRQWTTFLLLALNTHWLLDCFTTYGTQIFQPFSDYPVSFNSIFIIDPLYTVPLAVGVAVAFVFRPGSRVRRRANWLGLGLSTGYLLLTLGVKSYVTGVFESALDRQGITYVQAMNTPTPFNILLWNAIADDDDHLYIGQYSLLDDDRDVPFQRFDKRARLLRGVRDDEAVERVLWFSRGYYLADRQDDDLVMHDVRFGRTDMWLRDEGAYLFTFVLLPDSEPPADLTDLRLEQPAFDVGSAPWDAFLDRIRGRRP